MDLDLQKVLPAEAFETEQNEGDYIGKDGLLYCGVCRTKKQTRLPASDFTGGRGLIVLVLRHLADEVEKNNPGAKELAAGMEKCVGKPSLQEIEKIKKSNRR